MSHVFVLPLKLAHFGQGKDHSHCSPVKSLPATAPTIKPSFSHTSLQSLTHSFVPVQVPSE